MSRKICFSFMDLSNDLVEYITECGDHLESGLTYKDVASLRATCTLTRGLLSPERVVMTLEKSSVLAARKMRTFYRDGRVRTAGRLLDDRNQVRIERHK